MNLKKIGMVFTSKFFGTGPSSYEKRIYRAAVSQRLRNSGLDHGHIPESFFFRGTQSIKQFVQCIAIQAVDVALLSNIRGRVYSLYSLPHPCWFLEPI